MKNWTVIMVLAAMWLCVFLGVLLYPPPAMSGEMIRTMQYRNVQIVLLKASCPEVPSMQKALAVRLDNQRIPACWKIGPVPNMVRIQWSQDKNDFSEFPLTTFTLQEVQ